MMYDQAYPPNSAGRSGLAENRGNLTDGGIGDPIDFSRASDPSKGGSGWNRMEGERRRLPLVRGRAVDRPATATATATVGASCGLLWWIGRSKSNGDAESSTTQGKGKGRRERP
jgi:hypothetical protein